MTEYKIVIADQSEIIRKGLCHLLKTLPFRFQIIEIENPQHIAAKVNSIKPNLLIVNPSFILDKASVNLRDTFDLTTESRYAAIISGYVDKTVTSQFDELIYINDSQSVIIDLVSKLLEGESEQTVKGDKEIILSDRELDVLKLLVKGLSNKEISDQLFISTHTVISHRKNITRKLGIKSVAGLTVYALINNHVSMDDF